MPIKYIGLPTKFHGRLLWEILVNLRNFGVGRYVIKSEFTKFPEPSYFKILRAEPEMDPELQSGRVHVERVFRGVLYPDPIVLEEELKDPDFVLIHKYEEIQKLRQSEVTPLHLVKKKVRPATVEFPSFMKMILEEHSRSNAKYVSPSRLPLVHDNDPLFRVAESDFETVDVEYFSVGCGSTKSDLYSNINADVEVKKLLQTNSVTNQNSL